MTLTTLESMAEAIWKVEGNNVWGYGGSGAAFNTVSPLLVNLPSLGVDQALVTPGLITDFAKTSVVFTQGQGLVEVVTRVMLQDWTPVAQQYLVGGSGTI